MAAKTLCRMCYELTPPAMVSPLLPRHRWGNGGTGLADAFPHPFSILPSAPPPSCAEAWQHSTRREMRTAFAFYLNQIQLGQAAPRRHHHHERCACSSQAAPQLPSHAGRPSPALLPWPQLQGQWCRRAWDAIWSKKHGNLLCEVAELTPQ